MPQTHVPVMLDEVMAALSLERGGTFVDATFGRGGHSGTILARLAPSSRLIALDCDPDAYRYGLNRYADDPRFTIRHANFSTLTGVLETVEAGSGVQGILFDLGVSSPQLDDPARGFAFRESGPLDMRMDPETGVSAADWLATAEEGEIARVIKEFGEERFARRIAAAIVRTRVQIPIVTTRQLAELVAGVVPQRPGPRRIHPATRTFQALRIYLNGELEVLRAALPQAIDALAPGGRLVMIAFHSLEDRIVKRALRDAARPRPDPLGLKTPPPARLRLIGKAARAGEAEIARNPRARSAVLRVAEKLEAVHAP